MTQTEPFDGAARAVRIDLSLDASQRDVWDTITDNARLSTWLGGTVTIEPFVDGRVRFELPDDDIVATGVVRTVKPPAAGMSVALLTHTFENERHPGVVSECNWIVVDDPPGCDLYFTHDGFGELGGDAFATSLGRRMGGVVTVAAGGDASEDDADALVALQSARSILLVDFVGLEVPTVLLEHGFDVYAKVGPAPDDWAHAHLVDGAPEFTRQPEPPAHVDVVHLDWTLEFEQYLDVAARLGAHTYWFHSGRTRHPAPADSRGTWVPAPQSEAQRRATAARGLRYVDGAYIAEVARRLP